MIYQTDQTTGFYFYDGTAWTRIEEVTGPVGAFILFDIINNENIL
jgi:hypothetical protein